MTNFLRELNGVLALLVIGLGLMIRTAEALKTVKSKRLFVALLLFPIGVGGGSIYAAAKGFPSSPFVPYFTCAYIYLGLVVTVWWPESLTYRPNLRQETRDEFSVGPE